MSFIEIEIEYYPDSIIDVIVNSTKDSFVKIDEIKNNKYIIKIKEESFGPFLWDDKFSKDKIYQKESLDNLIFIDLELINEDLTQNYLDSNRNIIRTNKTKISKSKYLYLLNLSFNFNQKLLNLNINEIHKYKDIFYENLIELIDLNYILSIKSDFIILKLSNNLHLLPFQFISYYLAKKRILSLFLIQDLDKFDINFIQSLKNQKIKIHDLFFLKENSFEINEKLWNKMKINRIVFSNNDQFISGINISKIPVILAHGYRKKDFSSIKIGKNFFNPFYLNQVENTPQILLLLCCMINYSNSENNIINHFFQKGSKLILSFPYIVPIEYVEEVFELIIENKYDNIFELLIKILSKSSFLSFLTKILI